MTFVTVFVASVLGQLTALWIVGSLAHRQNMKKAKEMEEAFKATLKEIEEKEEKMREYARMES